MSLRGAPSHCHCEEHSDEAISEGGDREIATPFQEGLAMTREEGDCFGVSPLAMTKEKHANFWIAS